MIGLPNPIQYHVYQGQDLPTAWPYAYVLAANGVYKLVDTPHFYASLRIAPARVAGLCRWPEEGMLLRVPKIPAKWLRAVLEHAKQQGSGGPISRPIEQMYHFHHLPEGWRVQVPAQKASAGRVGYWGGNEATVVLDLHSHHEMPAFFSGTDNRDELGCRFYAVIGKIYTRPEIRLRLGLFGDFMELPVAALFQGLGEFVDSRDRAWSLGG